MSIMVQCGACGAKYQVAAAMAGKKVRCKKCGGVFAVPPDRDPDALPDEPDLRSVAAEEEPEDRAVATRKIPAPAAPRRPKVLPPVSQMADDSDEEEGEFDDESSGDSPPPTFAANPAFVFPASELLDAVLPYLIALVAIGWMVTRSLQSDTPAPAWVGHLRWSLYLAAYAFIVFPLTLLGVHRAGQKLRFGMPAAHVFKIFAVFTLPFMLGVILSLAGGSILNFATGVVVGLVVSLAVFWFLYRLRPRQTNAGLALVAAYFLGGVTATALLGVGINLLVLSGMKKAGTAYTLAQSPLGPEFSWDAPPPEPEPKHHPIALQTTGDETPTTLPATIQPSTTQATGAETTKPTTEPLAINTSTENPDKKMTPDVGPKPADPTTLPTTLPTTMPSTPDKQPTTLPVVALSPWAASISAQDAIGEFDDIIYPALSAPRVALVVRTRGPKDDVIELWNLDPLEKKSTLPLRHPENERAGYWLGPKAATLARLVDFPRKSIEIRSTTEDKVLRTIDLDTVQFGTPELIGFAANNQVGVLWDQGGNFGIEMFETIGGQHTRSFPLPQFERGRGNIAISPDGRFLAAAVKCPPPLKPDAGPRPDPTGAPIVPAVAMCSPTIQLTDVSAARIPSRLLPIPALGSDKAAIFSALIFSPDNQKLSMLYEDNGNCLIVTWKPPETKQISQSIIFGARPANAPADYHGNVLDIIPGTSAWLLYGTTILQSDHILGDLGIPSVKGHQFLNKDTIAISVPAESGKLKMELVKLNLEKFPGTKETLKAPAPMRP